jgi:transcriptional regulator with XRE-family HTH domain
VLTDEHLRRRSATRACPLLLEGWAVAYWSLTPSPPLHGAPAGHRRHHPVRARARRRAAPDREAEGRPPGVQGSVFRVQPNGAHAELEGAPTAARLGAALRAIRIQRHLSQAELAELARVSASAISQAERGRRGLALDTLLQLTSRSSMTIDELLRGEIARVPARAPPRLGASRRGAVPAARRSARRPARPAVAPLARPEHARGHAAHRRRARRGGGRPGPGHPADRPARAAAGRGAAGRAQRGERLAERGENDALIFWILRDEAVPAPMQ